MRRSAYLFAVTILGAAACGPSMSGGDDDGDDDGTDIDAGQHTGGDGGGGEEVTGECRKMDLIFVVDDSGSMGEEQTNLGTNFPMFANLLNSYTISTGEMLDYRAAVTTTGVTASGVQTLPPPFSMSIPFNQSGMDGRFRTVSGMTRPWLERTDPNMAQTFAQAAAVGTSGPGLEMQLRAMELAIQPGTNPGFLRDDALLGIVILTDEDDCSFRQASGINISSLEGCVGTPGIPAAADFLMPLDQVKGERGRWAAAVIAGQTACTSSFGDAVEGVRLKQFQQASPQNVVFGDICAGNLQGALMQALDSFQAACENFPPIGFVPAD
ncbi:MAG: hypothetical protein K8M05_30205 [Deltaproteobacteria bacterium]|nr:hypothetical protein [Kofleriaceae bacterium]